MTFVESIQTCLTKKYCDFEGRASKSEFWWFYLFACIIIYAVSFLMGVLAAATDTYFLIFVPYALYLPLFLPSLGAQIRRYHDSNHSGWWCLCPIMNFILLFFDGTPGENEYGPMPEQEQYQ